MSTLGTTNFRELYYTYKYLTRISGESTFTPLHAMILELKSNASSVPSTIGGGSHGYVGIILSPPMYDTLAP